MANTQNQPPLRSSPTDVQLALIDWPNAGGVSQARPVPKRRNRGNAVPRPMLAFVTPMVAAAERALFPNSLSGFRAYIATLKSQIHSTAIVRHTAKEPDAQTGDGSQAGSLPHGDKDTAGHNRHAGQQARTTTKIGSNMERLQTAPDQARSASPTGPRANPDDLTPPLEDATWSEVFPPPPARTIGIRVRNRTFYLFARKGGA